MSSRPAELDAWVLATAPRATAYARSLLRDFHQAEEIVQECYCRLLRKANDYDLPRDGLKLLLTAITNASINLKTRRRPMLRLFGRGDDHDESPPEIADGRIDDPADIAIGRELEIAVAEALAELPVQQRAAVQLKAMGYSQQEIAGMLKVSGSNAGVLIYRARQALARHLEPYLGEESAMTPEPHDERIDALVRAHMDRQEAVVDAALIRDVVRSRLDINPSPRVFARALRWGSGLVAAAAVGAVLVWGLPSGTVQASPEALVREAQVVHAGPVDRCYLVHTEWEPLWAKRFPGLTVQRRSQLWTRGDRFVIESGGEQKWAWGRDDQGNVWVALGSKAGLLFDADERADGLPVALDMFAMKLESLLKELPTWFDLAREDIDATHCRIVATPKPGRSNVRFHSATLEMDLRTKTVEKLVLRRVHRDEVVATVTFTLTETGELPDDRYQLRGHLDPDVKPFGPDRPALRDRVWKKVLEKRG